MNSMWINRVWIGALAALMGCLQVQATVYKFTGYGFSGDWLTPDNWDANGIAATNVTAAHRLNVNSGSYMLEYTADQGTTTYNITTDRGLVIGSGSSGSMRIKGGTFSTLGSTGGDVVGNGAGNVGKLLIDGGTFISTAVGIGLGIGGGPTSTMIVSNGTATVATLTMNATTANLNLAGGVLEVNAITRAANTGNMTFEGGTLRARADSTTFLQGLTSAKVESKGGLIDLNGKSITIAQNLVAGSTAGGGLKIIGTGNLTLNGTNTYTGATVLTNAVAPGVAGLSKLFLNTIGNRALQGDVALFTTNNARAYLQFMQSEQMATNAVISLNLLGSGNIYADLALQGTTQIISSVSAYWTPLVSGNIFIENRIYQDTGGGNGVLVLNGSSDTTLGSRVLIRDGSSAGMGTLKLVRQGAGALTISGANSYSGGTELKSGTLNVNNSTALGTGRLTISGGTLNSTGTAPVTISNPMTISDDFIFTGTTNLTQGTGSITLETTPTVTVSAGTLTLGGVIGGSYGLIKTGAGQLTLSGANTYTGTTTVQGGTLALASAGALSEDSSLSLAAGATFDTSAKATFTLGSSASFAAGGTTTASAVIAGGTSVDFASRPVALTFAPTSFNGDSDNPALTLSSGALTLNGAVSVVNNGGTALSAGTYVLIQQTSGSMTGTPTLAGAVGGDGIAFGCSAHIQVAGGNLELVVVSATPTTTTLARSGGTPSSSTYGDLLSFDVSVSPSAATGTVELRNGGVSGTIIASGSLSGGSAVLTPSETALAVGNHANLVAVYAGDVTYAYSVSDALGTQSVSAKTLTVSGATASHKLYDGTTNALITGTLVGIESGDTVTLIGTGWFASAELGTAIGVTANLSLDGASAVNYTVTQPTGLTADIRDTAVWTGGGANTFWSTIGNWLDGTVPGGATHNVNFAAVDGTTDIQVELDASRTVKSLAFGDTDPQTAAGWLVGNNGTPANTLTLATSAVSVGTLGTGKSVTVAATVTGTAGITKTGSGTLTLTANTTVSGKTMVSEGTLVYGGTYATTTNQIAADAVLGLNVPTGVERSYSTTLFNGGGTLRKSGGGNAVWGASVATFGFDSGALIDVQEGTLTGGSYNNDLWTGNKSDLHVAAGAQFSGVEANVRVDAITGEGIISTGYNTASYKALTIGVDDGSSTFNGTIANHSTTGNLIKVGSGAITLAGTNTYTGTTTISNGTLRLAATIGSTLQTNAAVKLAGGTLALAAVTQNIGSLTVEQPSTLAVQADSELMINGSVDLSNLTLSVNPDGLQPSQIYPILTVRGTLTTPFTGITGLPGDWRVVYDTTASPATVVLRLKEGTVLRIH